MAARRAQTISVNQLTRSINKAVRIAQQRHEVAVEKNTLLDQWEIFGRVVRGAADLNEAFKFAQDVTRNVRVPGLSPQPVAARIGRDILCGFIERVRLPRTLSR